jgi:hypothetical protein
MARYRFAKYHANVSHENVMYSGGWWWWWWGGGGYIDTFSK